MLDRTREDIIQAMNELIRALPMDKITVDMICKDAGVSKATFYRYFKDKYETLNYNYKRMVDYFMKNGRSHNYLEFLYLMYDAGKNNLDFIYNAFQYKGTNSLLEYIEQYSYETFERITKNNRNGRGFTKEEVLQMDIFCHGLSYMFQRLIFKGYQLDAKKAAKILYTMMPEGIRDYTW